MAQVYSLAVLGAALSFQTAAFNLSEYGNPSLRNQLDKAALLSMSHDELLALLEPLSFIPSSDDGNWSVYNNTDCAYDDIKGVRCQNQTVDDCKALCLNTSNCGGFNYPHGYLKQSDCQFNMAPSSSVNLYISHKPPPPPLPPSVNHPPIWPMPASYRNGSATVVVDATGFSFTTSSNSTILKQAFDRYRALMFFSTAQAASGAYILAAVTVVVEDSSEQLSIKTNESYTLSIPLKGNVTLTAATVFGALRGLETLSQLVKFDYDNQVYIVRAAPWQIKDQPRFVHREILVDSSRHFLAVPALKSILDSLPYAKINVMHWHLVDTQAFPFMSDAYPKLGSAGAYSPSERYSVADVSDVVAYAKARGVRVMLEIDTPGHAGSWCKGHPEICPAPNCTQPLNPATEATFDLLAGLFKEVTGGAPGQGLFPEDLFHLGGDEVDTTCWQSTPSVAAWLAKNNYTTDDAYAYFVNRTQAIAHSYGRQVVCWQEVWDHFGAKLKPDTIIHQWLPHKNIIKDATDHGYRVLWSNADAWYLPRLNKKWSLMYEQEPCKDVADDVCERLVLGGGGEMWGETVDFSDWHATVWPRLGAIAERLWSPRSVQDADRQRARMHAFRCLLNQRGIAAAPVDNKNARRAPAGPGSCYSQ